jgi:hypothetical protein
VRSRARCRRQRRGPASRRVRTWPCFERGQPARGKRLAVADLAAVSLFRPETPKPLQRPLPRCA